MTLAPLVLNASTKQHWKSKAVLDHLAIMGIGERILAARKRAGWSQQRLADAIAVSQTTISGWEKNRSEPKRDEVARIAAALNLDPAELEFGSPVSTHNELRTVPLVGYVLAGEAGVHFASGQGPFGEVEAPEGATSKTVAVLARGNSLGEIFANWIVYYDDVRSPVTADLFGRLCVVGLPDGRVLVKQLKPSRIPGCYHLISLTEAPILDQEVTWAAPVRSMAPKGII